LAAAVCCKHSRRNSDRSADNQRQESELQRRGVPFKNDLAHRILKFERLPKLATAELPPVVCVLSMERQIQTKGVTQLGQLARCGALPQHLLDGISRHDVNHEKTRVRTSQRAGSVRRIRLMR
jgi:hypothetical protein